MIDKGDLEGALRETRKATELEPFSAVMSEQVGELLRFRGRDSEAIAQYRKTLEMDGNFSWTHLYLGYVLAKLGKYDEALDEMKKAAAQNPSRFTLGIGYVYALSGETQKAREILRQELDQRKRNEVFGGEITALYIALGEKEKAIDSLEEGFRAQPTTLQWIKADPLFARLRDEPRFKALMKNIGLPE